MQGQRRVRAHEAVVGVDAEVLVGVAHDPQAIDDRIKIDAEIGAAQARVKGGGDIRRISRKIGHLRRGTGGRIDGVKSRFLAERV